MFTILFVCTGNTCRSTMAQAMARAVLQEADGGKRIKVVSAGTSVIPESQAAACAVKVMEEKGVDLRKHSAKQLSPELIDEADLVLTMTRNHKQHVLAMRPTAQDKVFTLKEYVQGHSSQTEAEEYLFTLAERLERKESLFYDENTSTLKSLKEQQKKLKNELQAVEKKIQDWHILFHEFTRVERQALKKFEEQSLDIDVEDPIGQPIEVYQHCADDMEAYIRVVLKKVAEQLGDKQE